MEYEAPDARRRPRDPYLATLLAEADPPTSDQYASKKVLLARKMDRLEALSRVKVEFIKSLNRNNEAKQNAILTKTDRHLRRVSDRGLERATNIFGDVKVQHEKTKSIPKRLNVIQKHCVWLEVEANQGYRTAADMDPKPTPELFPQIPFNDFQPTYDDLLNNVPSPFKAPEAGRDPILSGTLLRPYRAPPLVMEEKNKRKQRARERYAAVNSNKFFN